VVEEGRSLQRRARAPLRRDPTLLSLAGIPIPPLDETKHFKLIGTTGTGKSTAIRELLTRALARGDRALIADPDGGYLERFYDPTRGDVILNPFEARSRRWDLFAEIEQPYDVDQLARSLIPDSGSRGEQEWRQYARTFFTAVTRQLHEAGVRDLAELYRLITMAPVEELRALVGGTPAQPFLEPENARMFSSIRSVTTSALAALDYIQDQTAEPFSVREWVRRGAAAPTSRPPAGGVLFLPYQAAQIAALRAVIATWLRLAIFECMSQREGDQRLWIVIDELDALGTIDGLKDALARLRKFGGRCVLGFQSIAQVRSTYGDGDARTIVENCANTLILRCSASEGGGTAQFASQLIGEQQVIRPTLSRSHRPGDLQATTTRSTHRTVEPAVLPSEIEQLPDLVGFLKLASCTAWLDVRLIKSPRAVTAPVR
jgi:type IV secretory pathway TraG/TraD family ATPase VirD4